MVLQTEKIQLLLNALETGAGSDSLDQLALLTHVRKLFSNKMQQEEMRVILKETTILQIID